MGYDSNSHSELVALLNKIAEAVEQIRYSVVGHTFDIDFDPLADPLLGKRARVVAEDVILETLVTGVVTDEETGERTYTLTTIGGTPCQKKS